MRLTQRIKVKKEKIDKKERIHCPSCGSFALYRYGIISNTQRYICLICGRQFIAGHERKFPKDRPICSLCGNIMYVYKRESNFTRYRCSNYPNCKNTLKKMEEPK